MNATCPHRPAAPRAPGRRAAPARRGRASASALALAALLLGACATQPPLYDWGDYPRQQYELLKRDGVDPNAQITAMQAQAEQARAANRALPPGFRAHLGLLQLSVGHADEARAMWQAEKLAFPESAPYMDQLLGKLDGPKSGPTPSKAPA